MFVGGKDLARPHAERTGAACGARTFVYIRVTPTPSRAMSHVIPEFAYIVGFLACIIGVFLVANVVAAMRGYREK